MRKAKGNVKTEKTAAVTSNLPEQGDFLKQFRFGCGFM